MEIANKKKVRVYIQPDIRKSCVECISRAEVEKKDCKILQVGRQFYDIVEYVDQCILMPTPNLHPQSNAIFGTKEPRQHGLMRQDDGKSTCVYFPGYFLPCLIHFLLLVY